MAFLGGWAAGCDPATTGPRQFPAVRRLFAKGSLGDDSTSRRGQPELFACQVLAVTADGAGARSRQVERQLRHLAPVIRSASTSGDPSNRKHLLKSADSKISASSVIDIIAIKGIMLEN